MYTYYIVQYNGMSYFTGQLQINNSNRIICFRSDKCIHIIINYYTVYTNNVLQYDQIKNNSMYKIYSSS